MAKGVKTGGRVRGTPNKATVDIQARLAALKCDPIAGMAKIALNRKAPLELRARMYAELAGYILPKRKAVELSGVIETQHVALLPVVAKDKDEWSKRYNPTLPAPEQRQ